jgi:hypothetical protein
MTLSIDGASLAQNVEKRRTVITLSQSKQPSHAVFCGNAIRPLSVDS